MMPGVRGKIRKRDTSSAFVDSDSVLNDSLEINDLKKIDAGDSSAVNAETLPYEHTALTPTIHDIIASIIAGIDFVSQTITADGINDTFALTDPIDTAKPYLVFYNGMHMNLTDDFTFPTTSSIEFTFVPIVSKKIHLYYQEL